MTWLPLCIFQRFRHMDGPTHETRIEPLRLRVFLDHDVVEVFANDRFALATRVYTEAVHTGISLASQGGGWLESLAVWTMKGMTVD